ncbi:MAG: glycosyltransferase [Deltaproteobacteria bacterium]|nr:glycosyltransferase [Deltaproteobacteria bacterium]
MDKIRDNLTTHRRLSVILFSGNILLMFFLCLKGGFFGFIGKYFLDIGFLGIDYKIPAGQFILLYNATWLISVAIFFLYPKNLSFKKNILLILILSLVCRLALIPHEPSDDINRYLWEARLINEGINPYHHAPDDPALEAIARTDPYHTKINHPYNPAAYPPFVLYFFSFLIRISYTPLIIKFFMILFDMAAVWFIMLLLEQRQIDLRWTLLYALNPLILYSFAGQGHFDAMQSFFLLGAIFFYDRKKWFLMFVFAGLAIQTKYVAAAAIPFLIRRDNIKNIWILPVIVAAPYIPLIDSQWKQFFYCIIKFGDEYAFNGSIHGLLRAATGGITPATDICKIMLVVSLALGLFFFHPERRSRFGYDPIQGCLFAFSALLIFAPTVHFWYIAWIIPFAVINQRMSWIVLSLSISLYFVANGILHHTGQWDLPVWAQVAEWIPFAIIFFLEVSCFFKRLKYSFGSKFPETVSVVIPVKNEETRVEKCIKSVLTDKAVCEVVVVDAGSSDNTVEIARHSGVKVINHSAPPEKGGGRGGQICRGIKSVSGDVVAVVHADTDVEGPIFTKIINFLKKHPDVIGGAVGSMFDQTSIRLRLVEIANDFRMVFLGISFGDQVQFFRRKPIIENDFFPDIPLMEDVEFSIRLHGMGRQIYLFEKIVVSSRRWQVVGYKNFFSVIWRVALYLILRIRKEPDTASLYRSYYGKG